MKSRRRVAGIHAVESALNHAPERIVAAWCSESRGDTRLQSLLERLDALGVKTQPTNRARLESLAESSRHHQGIVIELLMPSERGEEALFRALESPGSLPFYLVLDHIQDPHNLGAILRTADAAGVQGVIVTRDQSVGLTPVVAKVASGAAETVPLYRVTNLARTLDGMKRAGIWVIGSAGEADKIHTQQDYTLPLALVMGAEGKGLRRLTRERCDLLVRIPMQGSVASLNLSVAAGVLIYEVIRQRSIVADR